MKNWDTEEATSLINTNVLKVKFMKILHVLYQSLPSIYGSSLRSRDIMYSQKEIGLVPIAITSPFQKGLGKGIKKDVIDTITYHRTSNDIDAEAPSETGATLFVRIQKSLRIFSFIRSIDELAKQEKPDIIHAHATFFCAIAAWRVAKKRRIPMVYEVRSLWEERALDQKRNFLNKRIHWLIRNLETKAMKLANRVVVINDNLFDNMVARGIDKKKITVVPNAVNTTYISNLKSNDDCHNSLQRKNLEQNPIVLGYIGTISPIEGLDMLIEVLHKINKIHNGKFILKIFGQGIMLPKLIDLVEEYNIKNVFFEGSIAPSNIINAYNEVDIIINPRTRSKLTETVTPLKPLEAMAYQKLVIGSDVGGLKELISDKETGFLFEADNSESLFDLLEFIANEYPNDLTSSILKKATDFVNNNRNWIMNAKKYEKIYNSLSKNDLEIS